jgi:signal transduction histidine kinase
VVDVARGGDLVNDRAAVRVAWSLWTIAVALSASAIALMLANPARTSVPATVVTYIVDLSFASVGALIMAKRPGNRIGALMLAVGVIAAIGAFALEYSWYSVAVHDATMPGTVALPLLTSSWWAPTLAIATVFLPLLFPDGHLPSRRWRPLAWIAGTGIVLAVVGSPFIPPAQSDWFPGFPASGWGDPPFGPAIAPISFIGATMFLAMFPFAVVALVQRFRRSRGEEREQMKWFVFGAAVLAVCLVIGLVLDSIGHNNARANLLGIGILAIPICTGIAILRSRLYDIDLVFRKAVVALVLAVSLGGIGVASLAIAGQFTVSNDVSPRIALVVGLLLGALLLPLLRTSRRIANRITFGRRATPYEVLTEFSSRVAETYETEDLAARMAQVVGRATGATTARVLLRVGSRVREAARWGGDDMDEHVIPVVHQGVELGALGVSLPANDPLDDAKERLVRDLAAQAGPVFRNLGLIEELKSSRQRLVSAQDEERRRLERNIHDGAQQQLVALSVKLRVLEQLTARDPDRAKILAGELQQETNVALEDLRDLARGIYPPLLADKGLAAALEAQARKAAVPVTVEAEGIGRFPQDVEATVYFCALEALNNVAKYAKATHAQVRLTNGSAELRFEVTDDGRGFDPSATGYGTGLQGMADRLAAIGGELAVTSLPEAGTTVIGRVPT